MALKKGKSQIEDKEKSSTLPSRRPRTKLSLWQTKENLTMFYQNDAKVPQNVEYKNGLKN